MGEGERDEWHILTLNTMAVAIGRELRGEGRGLQEHLSPAVGCILECRCIEGGRHVCVKQN